jgi:outer membrane protein TolC
MKAHLWSSAVSLLLALGGCAIGPNYSKPEVETPPAYKEAGDWMVAKPADAVPKGKWWEAFGDPVLNELEEQVSVSNQTLKAAEGRYSQARSAVQAARAGFFPTLGGDAGATRSRNTGTRYSVGIDARWEADLWGRIRPPRGGRERQRAGERRGPRGRAPVHPGELANTYFQLRVSDVGRELLEETVKSLQTNYDLTQNRLSRRRRREGGCGAGRIAAV